MQTVLKRKLIFFAVIYIFVTVILCTCNLNKQYSVFAETTPRYAVSFSYTCYYQYNTGITVNSSASNVTSATVSNSKGTPTELSVSIYGSAVSGEAVLQNGGKIKSKTVNIVVSSEYLWHSMKVVNSDGTEMGTSKTDTLTLNNLEDGTYTFSGKEYGQGWNPNPRAYATYYTEITFSFVVDTYVDNIKPIISGASTSVTGKYTNQSFTVTASDTGSGVDKLFWMTPSSGSYMSTSSVSKTISASSENGLYRFYATDKYGNSSSIYYVYLDTVSPSGTFILSNGNVLASGGTTKEGFSFNSADNGSGIVRIEYKMPDSSTWETYTTGTVFTPADKQGMYFFRVTDRSGNASEFNISLQNPCVDGHTYMSKVIAPTCTSDGYTIYIAKAIGEKCERCWKYRELGTDGSHPTLCAECAEALNEK